jgi:hypothetical protein
MGLVEVRETSDEQARHHGLSPDEALRAIDDPRKWRDWRVEPFPRDEPYYLVVATAAGRSVWEREITRRASQQSERG